MRYKKGTKCINIAAVRDGSAWPVGSVCTIESDLLPDNQYMVRFDETELGHPSYFRSRSHLIPFNKFFKRLYKTK